MSRSYFSYMDMPQRAGPNAHNALTLMDRRSSKTAETRPFGGNHTDLQLAQQSYTGELLPGDKPVAKRVRRYIIRLCVALIVTFADSPRRMRRRNCYRQSNECNLCNFSGFGKHRHQLHRLQRENSHGGPVQRFAAMLNGGGAAEVEWSVSGGDATAGAGTISAAGQYTPPSYLTADHVEVLVTATLKANPSVRATSLLQLTPGSCSRSHPRIWLSALMGL